MEELTKTGIISLLSQVNREGMGNVIAYLFESNYFTAHCHHHHRYKGGLAEHSLGVYWEMRALAPLLPDESCRIVALLHDLCTTRLEGYDDIARHLHGQRSLALLDVLGLASDRARIVTERDDDGYVDVIIIYVDDEETAVRIFTVVNECIPSSSSLSP